LRRDRYAASKLKRLFTMYLAEVLEWLPRVNERECCERLRKPKGAVVGWHGSKLEADTGM
jgi:hypothetical protein